MSSAEELSQDIRREIGTLEKYIEFARKRSLEERKTSFDTMKKKTARLKNLLDTFSFQIDSQEGSTDVATYKSELKQFKATIKKLEQEVEYLKAEGISQNQLYKGASTGGTPQSGGGPNSRQAMIKLGKQTQEQGIEALKNAQRDIQQMNEIATNVNVQLNKQIQQLDRIYDTVKDTNTTLKRAQKHVRYFARQIYTDKLMMCLIVLIIIAIIVIIILSALGIGKGNFNVPDQIV